MANFELILFLFSTATKLNWCLRCMFLLSIKGIFHWNCTLSSLLLTILYTVGYSGNSSKLSLGYIAVLLYFMICKWTYSTKVKICISSASLVIWASFPRCLYLNRLFWPIPCLLVLHEFNRGVASERRTHWFAKVMLCHAAKTFAAMHLGINTGADQLEFQRCLFFLAAAFIC